MPSEDDVIRIMMVDDFPLLREGLRSALGDTPRLQLVAFADHAAHVRQLCRELDPDVLLYSTRPNAALSLDQLETLHQAFPALKILLMVMEDQIAQAMLALPLGVQGVVLKSDPLPLMDQAIRALRHGKQWISPSIRQMQGEPAKPMPELSTRERQILELIARGWDNPAIGAELGLKEQTVRNYASQIYHKLDLSSRADAVIWAREHGFGRQG